MLFFIVHCSNDVAENTRVARVGAKAAVCLPDVSLSTSLPMVHLNWRPLLHFQRWFFHPKNPKNNGMRPLDAILRGAEKRVEWAGLQ